MILEIIRLEESNQGTISVMKIDKEVFCFALSPPDMLNQSMVSNIPTGQYVIEPYSSRKYPKAYEVLDVPNRSKILIHAGNTAEHTAGCILVGSSVGKLKGNRAVLNSGNTYKRFLDKLNGGIHHLTITENY